MLRLLVYIVVAVIIIRWGIQYNSDLPRRVRNSVRNNSFLSRFSRRVSARQFQDWATIGSLHEHQAQFQALPEEKQQAFEVWLKNLDEDEVKEVTKRTEQFCKKSHLDLRWLLNGETQKDPVLNEGAAASIVAYLIAYWEAHEIQDRAAAFIAYEKWEDNPNSRRNQAMTQALYNKLSEQDVVPSLPPDLVLASHKRRLNHIFAAIKTVAVRDRDIIYTAIEEIQHEKEKPASETRLARLGSRIGRVRIYNRSETDSTATTTTA